MLLPVTPCVTGNTDELKSSLWENWKVDEGDFLLPEAVPFLVVSAGVWREGKKSTLLLWHMHKPFVPAQVPHKKLQREVKFEFPSPQLPLEFFRIKVWNIN